MTIQLSARFPASLAAGYGHMTKFFFFKQGSVFRRTEYKLGMVVHTCNASTVGGSGWRMANLRPVGQFSEILFQNKKITRGLGM